MENKQKTALVVEDNEDIILGLEDKLGSLGYHVITVTQADAAIPEIAKLKSEAKKLDLLVTDNKTPGSMTGLELLGKINPEDGITSIIWTAGFTNEFELQARKAGASYSFIKPDVKKLYAKLEEIAKNPHAGKDSITR